MTCDWVPFDAVDRLSACCRQPVVSSVAELTRAGIVTSTLLFIILLFTSHLVLEFSSFDEDYLITAEELMVAIEGVWSDSKPKFGVT